MLAELWPFDYGRFEFRYDPASGQLHFMEVNLSCNLWSKKTISRAAARIGMDHATLVESIVAHSLARQGLSLPFTARVAARSEEHTSELQSLMRISYAVFCLKKKKTITSKTQYKHNI